MNSLPSMLCQELSWLPPHTFKRRKGARHLRFSVDGAGYLSITAPMILPTNHLLKAITKQRSWIEKHSCYQAPVDYNHYYPLHLPLRSFKENWYICYVPSQHKRLTLAMKAKQLILRGPIHDIPACQLKLRHWIRQRATLLLVNELDKISQEIGLTYDQLKLRTQKSRWGSCNSQKTITLNDKLLFLPYDWLRYVCIHELCHTQHMNHSKGFWQLVGQYDLNYAQHRKALHKAERYVPRWL